MAIFRFRKLTIADIAAQTGRATNRIRLTEYQNGVIDVEVLDTLTTAQQTALRNYVSSWGYVEDAQADTR